MPLVTLDATRRRAIGQILLLAAGFLVLVAISVASVLLVNRARDDNGWVVHTVEVENQINALLLEIRRAESAARGYLLTRGPEFLRITRRRWPRSFPTLTKLAKLTADNPVQSRTTSGNCARRSTRGFRSLPARWTSSSKASPRAPPRWCARPRPVRPARPSAIVGEAMRAEEQRLFAIRTAKADRSQVLASSVTIAGSGMVIALAGLSVFLVRRSSRARDEAEARLRDNNRQPRSHRRRAHRRSSRGQRRDPALRLYRQPRSALAAGEHHGLHQRARGIARRHLQADRCARPRRLAGAAGAGERDRHRRTRSRRHRQAAFGGFWRSARLHQILDRQDGPADIGDPQPHPRGTAGIPAGTDRHQGADRGHRRHRRASGRRSRSANPHRTAAEHRQRPPCAGADLFQSDRQRAEISEAGSSRRHPDHAAAPSSALRSSR